MSSASVGARLSGVPALLLVCLTAVSAQRGPQTADPQAGLIVGQVVDGVNGRPVGGAIVSISSGAFRPRLPSSEGGPPLPILTGADGRFVFRELPRGNFGLTARRSGYAEGAYGRRRPDGAPQQITLAAGERIGDVVVRIWKHGAITGHVLDEASEPLVGVQLRAFRRVILGGARRFVGAGTTLTDDRGIYRFGSLVPGEYLVAVASRSVAVPLSTIQDAVSGVPIRGLSPQLQVGSTIQLGDVLYEHRGGAVPPPPSAGRLFAYPPTFYPFGAAASHATTIAVGAGQEQSAIDLQIRPVPTVRVAGVLVGPEGMASGVRLRLVPEAASDVALNEDVATAVSDNAGRFEFPTVPEGQYMLRGQITDTASNRPRDMPATWWTAVPIQAGRDDIVGLTIPLTAGLRVSGRAEFEGAFKPGGVRLDQVPVVIEPADGVAAAASSPVRLDASGTFVSAGVPAGRYIVRVTGSPVGWMFKSAMYDGRDISIEPLELRSNDAAGVVLTFTDRWTGAQGMVHDSRGAPDADATVVVFPVQSPAWTDYGPSPRRLRSARTNANGSYVINSLPPGDYYAIALPDEDAADWQDPQNLAALARGATRLTVLDGEKSTRNLRTRARR